MNCVNYDNLLFHELWYLTVSVPVVPQLTRLGIPAELFHFPYITQLRIQVQQNALGVEGAYFIITDYFLL
jgi:hypothetical protein